LPLFFFGGRLLGTIDSKFNFLAAFARLVWMRFLTRQIVAVTRLLNETHGFSECVQLINLSNDSFILARAGRMAPRKGKGNSHDKTQPQLDFFIKGNQ